MLEDFYKELNEGSPFRGNLLEAIGLGVFFFFLASGVANLFINVLQDLMVVSSAPKWIFTYLPHVLSLFLWFIISWAGLKFLINSSERLAPLTWKLLVLNIAIQALQFLYSFFRFKFWGGEFAQAYYDRITEVGTGYWQLVSSLFPYLNWLIFAILVLNKRIYFLLKNEK